MKKNKPRGRFWSVSRLATVMEVSQSSIIAAARLTGKAVLPGGTIWFPTQNGKPGRPDRGFIGESIRADLAESRQQARIQHADA